MTSDIVEQKHWRKNSTTWSDYLMFFKIQDSSALITYVKILKTPGEHAAENKASHEEGALAEMDKSLIIKGFTENGEILFQFNHKSQGIEQSFGVNLKKYNAARPKKRDINRYFVDKKDLTEHEKNDEL